MIRVVAGVAFAIMETLGEAVAGLSVPYSGGGNFVSQISQIVKTFRFSLS